MGTLEVGRCRPKRPVFYCLRKGSLSEKEYVLEGVNKRISVIIISEKFSINYKYRAIKFPLLLKLRGTTTKGRSSSDLSTLILGLSKCKDPV